MVAEDGGQWIIKKFHPGRSPDAGYLAAVRALIPVEPGFASGSGRRVLARTDVRGEGTGQQLAEWCAGTILMPKVAGIDWAAAADRLRTRSLALSREARALLCRNLARAIQQLERAGSSHRDLSTGNVYLDPSTLEIALIDWDSLYHPSLTMPANTTCGSLGYIAPFVYRGGAIDAATTWGPGADRFALAICCVEFLLMGPDSPLAGDGGMFTQEELRRGAGVNLDAARATLRREAPVAAQFFERALAATSYAACPTPVEWERLAEGIVGIDAAPPHLDAVPQSESEFLAFLKRIAPPPPVWPVPTLPPAPELARLLPRRRGGTPAPTAPPLPDDPWERR
jgi:serine/threonine protein kinase